MDEFEQRYQALVERIRGYPMPEATRTAILAEIEATHRRERAIGSARIGSMTVDSEPLDRPRWGLRGWAQQARSLSPNLQVVRRDRTNQAADLNVFGLPACANPLLLTGL